MLPWCQHTLQLRSSIMPSFHLSHLSYQYTVQLSLLPQMFLSGLQQIYVVLFSSLAAGEELYSTMRRRNKEQRTTAHDNTDMCKLLLQALRKRDRLQQDLFKHIEYVVTMALLGLWSDILCVAWCSCQIIEIIPNKSYCFDMVKEMNWIPLLQETEWVLQWSGWTVITSGDSFGGCCENCPAHLLSPETAPERYLEDYGNSRM